MLDVFAEEKYSGNQLAVFMAWEGLGSAEMQKVAAEIGFSETTFITSSGPGRTGFGVRIFTPKTEVPFAGHPVLGTAYVIHKELLRKKAVEVRLSLKVGTVPVSVESSDRKQTVLTMRQPEPEFGKTHDPREVSAVLGIKTRDIDKRYPVQEVSTGLPMVIVPLTGLDSSRRISLQRRKYFSFVEDSKAKAIFVFCPETYERENQLNVRMFAPYFGIEEDPATGSGNGCLAAYLLRHGYFGDGRVNVCVEQGMEIGRPSRLYIKAEKEGRGMAVYVGGKVVPVFKGKTV